MSINLMDPVAAADATFDQANRSGNGKFLTPGEVLCQLLEDEHVQHADRRARHVQPGLSIHQRHRLQILSLEHSAQPPLRWQRRGPCHFGQDARAALARETAGFFTEHANRALPATTL